MLTSEHIPFLARALTGGILAWAAVWVAFGPEIARTVGRLVAQRAATPEQGDAGDGSEPA
jgi:hypothetical protein